MSSSPARHGRVNPDPFPLTRLEEVEPVAPAARSLCSILVTAGRLAVWAMLLLWLLGVEGKGTTDYYLQQSAWQQSAVAARMTTQLIFGTAVAFCLDRVLALVLGFDKAQGR
jgi:hypothetical protein